MWPFAPKEKTQSSLPKETSAAEDWDLSLWLLDPDRTVEELDYFAQTGQRPTKFTKMPPKAAPKENFALVEYPPQKEKPLPNFPQNPAQGHTWLDRETGTYYVWSGAKWRILANTPPQARKSPPPTPSLLDSKSADEWLDRIEYERNTDGYKRPFFSSKLEEKQWCAKVASEVLGCEIKVYESLGTGLIIIDGQEFRHSIENWDWHNKTIEEFFEHLYRLRVKQSKSQKND